MWDWLTVLLPTGTGVGVAITSAIAFFKAVKKQTKTVETKTEDSLKEVKAIKEECITQSKLASEVLDETKNTKNEIKEMADKCRVQINETSEALKKMNDLNEVLKKLSEDVNVLKKQYKNRKD